MNLHNTSLLAPSSLEKARKKIEGCYPVEQDGFTSANICIKTARRRFPVPYAGCRVSNTGRHAAFELTPCHCHVILIDRVAYVTLWVAMAQMQLVTQPIAHSYRRTELWLYNYVRHAPSM